MSLGDLRARLRRNRALRQKAWEREQRQLEKAEKERRAEEERRILEAQQTAEAGRKRLELQAEAESATEIPDLEEWDHEVWGWPNEDARGEIAYGVNGAQRHFLNERTALRWNSDGIRVFGADIWSGGRRQRKSSRVRGIGARACMAWPGFRYVQALEDSTASKLDPVSQEWATAVGGLKVRVWREGWRPPARGEYVWRYRHPKWPQGVVSTYEIVGAGYSQKHADRRGRGTGIDLIHYADAATFPHFAKLFRATAKAVPRTGGWIVAESTMPNERENWFASQFYLTRERKGQFLRAIWTPWYMAEQLRIQAGTEHFLQAMATEDLTEEDLQLELAYKLSEEQKAYRRWYRCRGTLEERRAAAREDPETPEETHVPTGDQIVPLEVQERLRGQARVPPHLVVGTALPGLRWLTPQYAVKIWKKPAALLLGGDRAAMGGRDLTGIPGLDPTIREQVLQLHGRCTDHEFAKCLLQLLQEVFPHADFPGYETSRVCVVLERNHCQGAIDECVTLGIPLWCGEDGNPGVPTGGHNRPQIITSVIEAIDGAEHLRWVLRGSELIEEICSLRRNPNRQNRIEGFPHDDLVIGLGEVALVAPLVQLLPSAKTFWTPARSPSRGARLPR